MVKEAKVSERRAPTARKPARTEGLGVKNLVFIRVGLLIETKLVLQVRKILQKLELAIERLVEQLFGHSVVWLLFQLIE